MRTASADIAIERLRNFHARRLRILVQQGLRRDQDAGEAISALAGLLVEKGLLQRMRASGIAKAFDRDDLFSCDAPDGLGAAFFRNAVDQHDAATALLKPAAETRPFQSERVS